MKPEEVLQMESRLSGQDIGFDADNDNDEDANYIAPAAYLPDPAADPARIAEEEDWNQLYHQSLPTRHERGAKYGVSAERIGQLEANSMKKLKAELAA